MTKLAKPQLVGVTWKDMYDKYDRMSKVSEKAVKELLKKMRQEA